MKIFLCSVLLLTSVMSADWLDDVVISVVEQNDFNADKTLGVIQKYVDQDKKEIAALEKQELENTQDGVLATVRGGTYTVALFSARSSLKTHEHAAKFIKELHVNKKEKDTFVASCKALDELKKELSALEKKYEGQKGFAKKAETTALIALKKVHIEEKKAMMKMFTL